MSLAPDDEQLKQRAEEYRKELQQLEDELKASQTARDASATQQITGYRQEERLLTARNTGAAIASHQAKYSDPDAVIGKRIETIPVYESVFDPMAVERVSNLSGRIKTLNEENRRLAESNQKYTPYFEDVLRQSNIRSAKDQLSELQRQRDLAEAQAPAVLSGRHVSNTQRQKVSERNAARGFNIEQINNQIKSAQDYLNTASLNPFSPPPKQSFDGIKYSSSSKAVGGGMLGSGDTKGRVISTSRSEDAMRSGYYSGTPTLDPRVTDLFSVPTSTPTVSPSPSRSTIPTESAITKLDGSKIGVRAGVKSIVAPIQNRELRGSTITARQLKDIRAGKLTEAQAIAQNQTRGQPRTGIATFESSKILPQVAPSSSAFLSIPGVQFAAGEVAPPQAPRPPPKLTQAQVNALSDSEYAQYQADFERYNQEYSQYQKDYAGYADTIKVQNKVARLNAAEINLQSDKDLKKYIADTKADGYKLISFATPTGEKTVPIDRAYREIQIASKNVMGIGSARLDKRYGAGQNITGISAVPILESGNVFAGSISNPILLPEPEKKPYGPQVGATFGAQKEFERITGLKTGLQPITSRIDAAFELDKPLQQRSPDARAVGTFLAPATNLVGGLANLGKIAIGKGELTGERAGALNLPQYKEAPQERTTLGDIMEGRPVNLNDPFARISLYGEAALFGAGILGAKAGNKLGQKIETKIKVGAETREAKTVAKGLARQSDAPFGISKKGRAFEFEQGIEPARTRGFKITEKIDPTLQLKRIGRTVEAKFTKTPKQTNIPEVPKNPQPRVPYAYIQPGKRGVTAEVLSKPIKGSKDEIGAIIKGTLSRQERKRLGASLASEPGSPLDIYTVKATDSVIKVLSQAEKSGYLKRITDIRLSPTKEAAKTVRKGNQSFYEKYIKNPQTVGYYETLQGTGRKITQTTGYQTPLGSKSLNEQLKRIGLSTAEARSPRSYKPMTSFGDIKINIGTGGSVGKAQSISKQDENILRNLVPKLAGETKKKPRQDAFGDIGKSFPYAGLGYGGEDQAFAYEPESISRRRPLTGFGRKESNLSRLTGKSLVNTNEELKRAIKVGPDVGSLRIAIPKLGIRPETRQRQPQGLGLVPMVGLIPAQQTTPIQKQGTQTIPKLVPKTVTPQIPFIPKIPEVPRVPELFKGFKFPRDGFGFLIPGGGTGGLGRGPKMRIKKFVASEADPLRAGVLVPDNVTELVGYSPAVFRQIDINLGKERRRKGRTGGIDAEPFKGFGDSLLIKNNLNIRL